jgi:Asp/Glu/hydantoin racemase
MGVAVRPLLARGDRRQARGTLTAGHAAAGKAAVRRLAGSVDVIVLAQASMAHLAADLSATLPVPVLESPSLCVEGLAPYLEA